MLLWKDYLGNCVGWVSKVGVVGPRVGEWWGPELELRLRLGGKIDGIGVHVEG